MAVGETGILVFHGLQGFGVETMTTGSYFSPHPVWESVWVGLKGCYVCGSCLLAPRAGVPPVSDSKLLL